jgi:hypothetical protein
LQPSEDIFSERPVGRAWNNEELNALYDPGNQLVKALPKMVKAASSDELRQGF